MIRRCKVVNPLKKSKLGIAKQIFLCYKHSHEMRDDEKERMNDKNFFILSGKYKIIRTLGRGSFSTVYLARHQVLELELAIKVTPKAQADQLSVLNEARLLKSIHHPGIPIIYDIEEDEDAYYLIEEYVCGESLETFLFNQPFISRDFFFSICSQLCDIFIYLHTFLPVPVLYQDLKPEHIIVCGEQIKLIDFGVSSYITKSGNNFNHFGNKMFSAPENFSNADLSISADVYSIGMLMQFLSKYVDHLPSKIVSHIIQKSISSDPKLRYETVEELQSELQKEFFKLRSSHLYKNIAVVGSHSGCGTTHIAIALVSTLNLLNRNCYYMECNNSDSVHKLSNVYDSMYELDGCYYLQCFRGYPKYGPGISITYPNDAIYVSDCGFDLSSTALAQADLILFVCDDAPWNWYNAIEQNDFLHTYKDHLRLICNPGNKKAAQFYAKAFGLAVYPYFVDPSPFQVSHRKIHFFDQLLQQKGQSLLCLAGKKFPFRSVRR